MFSETKAGFCGVRAVPERPQQERGRIFLAIPGVPWDRAVSSHHPGARRGGE